MWKYVLNYLNSILYYLNNKYCFLINTTKQALNRACITKKQFVIIRFFFWLLSMIISICDCKFHFISIRKHFSHLLEFSTIENSLIKFFFLQNITPWEITTNQFHNNNKLLQYWLSLTNCWLTIKLPNVSFFFFFFRRGTPRWAELGLIKGLVQPDTISSPFKSSSRQPHTNP